MTGDATVIVRITLRECLRRRIVAVVGLLTAGFLALYAVATHLAFATLGAARVRQAGTLVDAHALAGASLLGLAMFATLFLGAVLAVFLTFNVVRGDAEQGLLQPLVVRPLGRAAFLAGRYAATCGITAVYVAIVYGAAVAITGLEGGWWPDSIVVPGLALAGAACVVAAISLLGSVYLSTVANGIAVLMVYGAGLVAGLLGQIGYALPSERLQTIGRDASWALPFDALYQAGLHALTADTNGFTGVIVHLGPLGGAQGAGPLLGLWAAGYVAVVLAATAAGFNRRDL
jgi:ABC-2 type transport system permease protein